MGFIVWSKSFKSLVGKIPVNFVQHRHIHCNVKLVICKPNAWNKTVLLPSSETAAVKTPGFGTLPKELKSWFSSNFFKQNSDETEFLPIGTKSTLSKADNWWFQSYIVWIFPPLRHRWSPPLPHSSYCYPWQQSCHLPQWVLK